jgi:hypothetical protein
VAWNRAGSSDAITLKPLEIGAEAVALGVNDAGLVVGSAANPTEQVPVAPVWQLPGTKLLELARPQGIASALALAATAMGAPSPA